MQNGLAGHSRSILQLRPCQSDHWVGGYEWLMTKCGPNAVQGRKGLIKAQKLRNARQILDLAIPDKIWPRSQKPKNNKGRHPLLRLIYDCQIGW